MVFFPVRARHHISPFPRGESSHVGSLELLTKLQCFYSSMRTSPPASLNVQPLPSGNSARVAPAVDERKVMEAEQKTTVDNRRTF